jgi:hypothetical protein
MGLVLGAWLAWAQDSTSLATGRDQTSVVAQQAQNVEWVGQIGGPAKGVASLGDHAYVLTGPWLVILDTSDAATPIRVGAHQIPEDDGRDVFVVGEHAYLAADEGGLRILNVADPAHPVEVGFSKPPLNAYAVTVLDGYAYVADRTNTLRIVEVADPVSPTLRSTYAPSINDYVQDVAVRSDGGQVYAYLGASNHLFIVDFSSPSSPVELGVYTTTVQAVVVDGTHAYVAAGEDGLSVIDVSQPHAPSLLDTLDTPGFAYTLALSGTHAYVADAAGGLRIVDISVPGELAEDGFYDTPDSAQDVALAGNWALVADDERGVRLIDVTDPAAPMETGAYDVTSAAWSVAISGTLAYVGDYYYDPGLIRGALRVIDISNSAQPAQTGFAALSGRGTGVALWEDHAFLSGYQHGLLVVDVSDPFSPAEVISYPTSTVCDDVAVAGNYAYLAESQGLYLFDITDPLSPTLLSLWPTPGDSVNTVAVEGQYAYAGVGRDGLHILDISDPANPSETGAYTVSDSIYDVAVLGDLAYLAVDAAGLHIVDVSDPASPHLVQIYDGWETVQAVAVTSRGSGSVLAYILGEIWDDEAEWVKGLAVLDVSDPDSTAQLGFYRLRTEAYSLAVDQDTSGGATIYLANQSGGLVPHQPDFD